MIAKFVNVRTFDDYRTDDMLHAAIGRELMIVGEAMRRLSNDAPELTEQIPERRQIIAFRNILVHGYDIVDDAVIWDIVQSHLPLLVKHVDEAQTLNTDANQKAS